MNLRFIFFISLITLLPIFAGNSAITSLEAEKEHYGHLRPDIPSWILDYWVENNPKEAGLGVIPNLETINAFELFAEDLYILTFHLAILNRDFPIADRLLSDSTLIVDHSILNNFNFGSIHAEIILAIRQRDIELAEFLFKWFGLEYCSPDNFFLLLRDDSAQAETFLAFFLSWMHKNTKASIQAEWLYQLSSTVLGISPKLLVLVKQYSQKLREIGAYKKYDAQEELLKNLKDNSLTISRLDQLLQDGADLNSNVRQLPLCLVKSVDMAQELIRRGAKVHDEDISHDTRLLSYASYEDIELFKLFLDNGADFTIFWREYIDASIEYKRSDILENTFVIELLQRGADTRELERYQQEMERYEQERAAAIAELKESSKNNTLTIERFNEIVELVIIYDHEASALLENAVKNKNIALTKALLSLRGVTLRCDYYLSTLDFQLLRISAINNDVEMFKLLASHGADIQKFCNECLLAFCNTEILKEILTHNLVITPVYHLRSIAEIGNIELARLILEGSFSILEKDHYIRMLGSATRHPLFIKFLFGWLQGRGIDITCQDISGIIKDLEEEIKFAERDIASFKPERVQELTQLLRPYYPAHKESYELLMHYINEYNKPGL